MVAAIEGREVDLGLGAALSGTAWKLWRGRFAAIRRRLQAGDPKDHFICGSELF